MKRRIEFNPKRKIRDNVPSCDIERLERTISYTGNPEHKQNPGDFGLKPPSQPRADKTLCDTVQIFTVREAIRLLKAGVRKGMIGDKECNGYPKCIWSVTPDGKPLEAKLENEQKGTYHGYPVLDTDSFGKKIVEEWKKRP